MKCGTILEANETECIMSHCYEPDRESIDPNLCIRCKHRREGIAWTAFHGLDSDRDHPKWGAFSTGTVRS